MLAAFLREDGLILVLLAVSGIDDLLTVFKPDEKGNVIVSSKNDSPDQQHSTILAAAGKSFEAANAAVMYEARRIVMAMGVTENQLPKGPTPDNDVDAQWLEEWYDGLTYCTWNGLGQNLTANKVYEALDTLKQNDVTITNLIIDDNWQSLDHEGESQFKRAMTDFEANKVGFPDGMKATVTKIRSEHPNVKHISVWHAILGYWGGVSPEGSMAKEYKTKIVKKQPGVAGGTFTVVDPDDVHRMYNDFYEFLASTGVDSVKTDAQFFLDLLEDAPDRRRFIKEYQDAWSIASLRHFGSKNISCMSQTPQILFYSQLPNNKPRLMVRNSDDFFPDVPTSHPWHVFCNAHNTLLTQHLNILPDWDMFQTSHPYSSFHAAARCVSGGPIYFTDEPGKHDIDLIRQMTAATPRGNTVILRPHVVGKSIEAFTDYHEELMLKIGTYVGMAQSGSGILGVFNASERALSELVSLRDFPGVQDGRKYIIRAHTSGQLSGQMVSSDPLAVVSLALDVKGWEIFTSYPLLDFQTKSSKSSTSIAVLGLIQKMTGVAGVVRSDTYLAENGRLRIWTSLKALGVLGIYISDLYDRNVKDMMIIILGKPIPAHCAVKSAVDDGVLEVDVEKAWKEMGLSSGWSNEVAVEVFLG